VTRLGAVQSPVFLSVLENNCYYERKDRRMVVKEKRNPTGPGVLSQGWAWAAHKVALGGEFVEPWLARIGLVSHARVFEKR
jgi:hypothetical protein